MNQGWKDSWDGINFADGTLAEAPIALSEVQGYVYAAYVGRARLARALGDHRRGRALADRAGEPQARFQRRVLDARKGFYAVALDGDKTQVDSVTSNIGHCLWTGIVDAHHAAAVADRLMAPDMFTGWGIRTLASTWAPTTP